MEQFSSCAKLRGWLWSVVLFLVEKKKLLPYLTLKPQLMPMGKNILIFEERQAQEHIACWGGGNASDCSYLKNRLEKCWCFKCSESFPEQCDRMTSWEAFQPGASGFASFIFRTALTFEARVKEQVLKGGQSDGQPVIKSVIKSCSQMLLSIPKFFMYFYLEDVSFSGLMTLQGAGWVSAMKSVGSLLTCFQERRVGPAFLREMFRIPTPQTTCFREKYYCRSLRCVRSEYFYKLKIFPCLRLSSFSSHPQVFEHSECWGWHVYCSPFEEENNWLLTLWVVWFCGGFLFFFPRFTPLLYSC